MQFVADDVDHNGDENEESTPDDPCFDETRKRIGCNLADDIDHNEDENGEHAPCDPCFVETRK